MGSSFSKAKKIPVWQQKWIRYYHEDYEPPIICELSYILRKYLDYLKHVPDAQLHEEVRKTRYHWFSPHPDSLYLDASYTPLALGESNIIKSYKYIVEGDYLQANRLLQSFCEEVPFNGYMPIAHFFLGCSYQINGKPMESMKEYDLAIKYNLELAVVYYNRGLANHTQNNYFMAITDYNRAISLKPKFATAYYNRALAKQVTNDYEGALIDYNTAIALKFELEKIYYNRGLLYYRQNNFDKAIFDFDKAIELKPDYAQAFLYRGYVKEKQNNLQEAIQDYNEAIKIKTNYSEAYAAQGRVNHTLCNYEAAIEAYNKAIKFKPDSAELYEERAISFEALNQHQKAQDDHSHAHFLIRKETPEVCLYQAIVTGQRTVAVECLQTIHNKYPNRPPLLLTPKGEEPALLTLAEFGHTAWLADFLKRSLPTVTDNQDNSAFHTAAHYGQFKFFETLVNEKILRDRLKGGYEWPTNCVGETPFHSAAIGGQTEFLIRCKERLNIKEELEEANIQGNTIVHLMVKNGHYQPLKTLLPYLPFSLVRVKNQVGEDGLMLAIRERRIDIVKLLLKHHVDLANQNQQGLTALEVAIDIGELEIVKLLVNKGAFINENYINQRLEEGLLSAHGQLYIFLSEQTRKTKHKIQHFKKSPRKWRNLVFQGGSIKGLAYPSALREMVKRGLCTLEQFERVGGTSAGAITALLVGLGYNLEEIEHLTGTKTLPHCSLPQLKLAQLLDGPYANTLLEIKNQKWEDVAKKESKLGKISEFIVKMLKLYPKLPDGIYKQLSEKLSFCPGEKLYELFEQLIRDKYSSKVGYSIKTAVTFKELHEAGFKDLYFVGTNTQTGEAEYFSHEHTPDMVVANAVRISMSIPIVFYPVAKMTKDCNGNVQSGQVLYVDGGVSRNYPIQLFDFMRYQNPNHFDHSLDNTPHINKSTIGLRLVAPELKARYERKGMAVEDISLTHKSTSITSLWGHLVDLLAIFEHQQESNHALSGDECRTIYIDTLDIGMLDFERIEEEATKKLLAIQGKEAVEDFVNRATQEEEHYIQLPEELESSLLKYIKIRRHQKEYGQYSIFYVLDPHCPELVVDFYSYEDPRIQNYLHTYYNVSLYARDNEGMTAFHIAASKGNIKALQHLLEVDNTGALLKNHDGHMPYQLSETQNFPDILSLLEEYREFVEAASIRPISGKLTNDTLPSARRAEKTRMKNEFFWTSNMNGSTLSHSLDMHYEGAGCASNSASKNVNSYSAAEMLAKYSTIYNKELGQIPEAGTTYTLEEDSHILKAISEYLGLSSKIISHAIFFKENTQEFSDARFLCDTASQKLVQAALRAKNVTNIDCEQNKSHTIFHCRVPKEFLAILSTFTLTPNIG